MRIAVFIKKTTFHKGYGGIETQNKSLCEGLTKRGHEVFVFSPKLELDRNSIVENGVRYIFVSCAFKMDGFFGERNKDNWFTRSAQRFEEEHAKQPFDVVIGQSSAAVGVIKRKWELNIKVVSVAHGTIISEYKTFLNNMVGLREWIKIVSNTGYVLKSFFSRQREYVHGSEKVVAVSNFVKSALVDETFVDAQKVEVIHNGVDGGARPIQAHPNNQPLKLVYIGRLERSKGLQNLLKAISRLNNVTLSVIGDGPYLPQLARLVKSLHLSERLIFVGRVAPEKIPEILSQANVFVYPSLRYEGFPMAVVEAMFCGLPVIASNIGGISDALENGTTGYLVKSGIIADLRDTISEFVNKPDLIRKMGDAAYAKAQREFNLDTMLSKYEKILEDVVK